MLRKISISSSIAAFCIVTIGTFAYLLQTSLLLQPAPAVAEHVSQTTDVVPAKSSTKIIEGTPSRIVIPSRGIDLAIDNGHYDSSTKTWSLHDSRAQFAVMTSRPNNRTGMTFIYGHGTDAVFGKIGSNPPPTGSVAKLFTKNNRVFTYVLQSVKNLQPNDTSIFKNTAGGKPRLVVQTCTGFFSEWRTMFTFAFQSVTKA